MNIRKITGDKKEYIDLLLLADEQESMIEFLFSHYNDCKTMLVGTSNCHSILSFYNICGFTESHRIKNFFIDNYDHPMFEDGKQLVDMVYLKRER